MSRRPPRSTLTDTPFPYTTLFRSDPELMPLGLRAGLAGCVIVVAARVGAGWFDSARDGEAPRICQASLFVLLLLLVPIGFGWLGAGRKDRKSTRLNSSH